MKKKIYSIVIILFLGFFASLIYNAKNSGFVIESEAFGKHKISYQKLFDNAWSEIKDNYYDASFNNQIWYRWKEHYRGKIKTEQDANVAINTMLASLNDPYSVFLTAQENSEQNSSINAKIVGIGVNITSEAGKIMVLSVMDGSPAQNVNILPQDVIYAVNGKEVSGMQIGEVANLVRGEENTFVEITVLRDNNKITKRMQRKEIKLKSVKATVEPNSNIGYIQISSFVSINTPSEFIEALEKTRDTKGLILDLRGNTGGLLPNATFIANLFIPDGTLVSIVGRDGYKFDINAQELEYKVNKPIVVLIDGHSASASEILSGALKDYQRAVLLGTRTYGKGMVQKIIPLNNGTCVNLTIAKYLTPKGNDINKKGIEPDYKVEFTLNDLKNRNDIQLSTAKSILNGLISKK